MTAATLSRQEQPDKVTQSQMIWHIAAMLSCKGYNIRARHEHWPAAPPYLIDNHRPDIIAYRPGEVRPLIFEVATCNFTADRTMKDRLLAFRNHGRVFVIVPFFCENNRDIRSPVAAVKKILCDWGMAEITVGTCNPESGAFSCRL